MGEPFVIELHMRGGKVVTFKLSEDDVRDRASWPENARAMQALTADAADDRSRLRNAAYQIVLRMVETFQQAARAQPLSVSEGNGVWVMPVDSLEAVRLRDPQAGEEQQPFRFAERAQSSSTTD